MTAPGPDGAGPRSGGMVDGPGWQLFAYSLWVGGCVLFALVAADNRDWLSLAASLLFLFGVVAVMIPLERQRRSG
ncbi:MAG: hypothetical protein AAGA65_18510 [Actinomycetota bacterium]